MVWESKTTRSQLQGNPDPNQDPSQNNQDYTKHYVYEPNSLVPVLQTVYRQFTQLIKTPDYNQFKTMPYSIQRDPVWNTDTRKSKVELERVAFYHCDQVGTPKTLSNEKGECIWEIELNTWGKTQQVKAQHQDQILEHTNIRFQGQYYDEETGLHYNRYRYYEPHSGRYISKDPIGVQGGWNNSAYVSDPNQWVDPMGLVKEFIHPNGTISDRYVPGSKGNNQEAKRYIESLEQTRKAQIQNQKILAVQKEKKEKAEQGLNNYNKWATENNVKLANDRKIAILQQEKLKKEKEEEKLNQPNFVDRMNERARNQTTFRSRRMTIEQTAKSLSSYGDDPRRHGCKGTCQMYDYLSCTGSLAGQTLGMVKNLRAPDNEGWYMTAATSPLLGNAVSIPKSMQLKQIFSVPQSLKDVAGWSCSAGVISGLDPDLIEGESRQNIVHQFVNGASYTIGGVVGTPLFGIGYNRVKAIVPKGSIVYGAVAHEVVVGSSGINVDFAGTGLLTSEKYE